MTDMRSYSSISRPTPPANNSWAANRMSPAGQLYTANWKTEMVLEGDVYHAAFGAMGATDITELTAGSDLDQPDFCISVPTGTTLIPLRIDVAAKVPSDADDADAFFIVVADTAAAYAGDGTVTSVTPTAVNSGNSNGTAATVFEDASADITDPTTTAMILVAKQQQVGMTTSGVALSDLNINWEPDFPIILPGPCAIYGYGGGADTVTYVAGVWWAERPSTLFTT